MSVVPYILGVLAGVLILAGLLWACHADRKHDKRELKREQNRNANLQSECCTLSNKLNREVQYINTITTALSIREHQVAEYSKALAEAAYAVRANDPELAAKIDDLIEAQSTNMRRFLHRISTDELSRLTRTPAEKTFVFSEPPVR